MSNERLPQPAELQGQYLLWLRMKNCSPVTLQSWRLRLTRFIEWSEQRGIESLRDVTPDLLAAYRRWLFHYRNPKTGAALKFASQGAYLMPIRRWFAWLHEAGYLQQNVAADLELPKEEQRLPTTVLTAGEVERILNATDVGHPLGLRDRALLETLYSTAIRCSELTALQVYDLEPERRILSVRQGKGRKDRVVPLGERALAWLEKYLADVRPRMVEPSGEATLFVTSSGRAFGRTHVSALVRRYIERAGVAKPGSCHLFRHTTVTLMMEAGADVRTLQLLLGHARLNTTQLYTHVSIERLRQVHERTHPASPKARRAEGDANKDDANKDDAS